MTALIQRLRSAPSWLTDQLTLRRWQIIATAAIAGAALGYLVVLGLRESRHAADARQALTDTNDRQDRQAARLADAIRQLRALNIRTAVLRGATPAQLRRLREFLTSQEPSASSPRGGNTPAPPRLVVPRPTSPRRQGVTPAPPSAPPPVRPPPNLILPPPATPQPNPLGDLLKPVCPLIPPTPELPVQAPMICQ